MDSMNEIVGYDDDGSAMYKNATPTVSWPSPNVPIKTCDDQDDGSILASRNPVRTESAERIAAMAQTNYEALVITTIQQNNVAATQAAMQQLAEYRYFLQSIPGELSRHRLPIMDCYYSLLSSQVTMILMQAAES